MKIYNNNKLMLLTIKVNDKFMQIDLNCSYYAQNGMK